VRAPIFQLDSFTTTRFAGNPAAVVVLEQFLPKVSLQAIAAENKSPSTRPVLAATPP
jgi:predicted PhzF superfamily epimerase YddE/YHI9